MKLYLAALLFATLTFSVAAQPDQKPKNATEWFQRAADQMNLRAFGSDVQVRSSGATPLPLNGAEQQMAKG